MTTLKEAFSDDFSRVADDVDRNKWRSPHWTRENNKAFIGRTGIRNPTDFTGELGRIPCTKENGADLRLCTHNPKAEPAGSAFLGSEIHTVQKWGGKGETVKFEARVKCPPMSQGGAVTSVFSFALCAGQVQNEIDFEFASNHWVRHFPKKHQELFTNVFVCRSGVGSGPKVLTNYPPGFLQDWHTFSLIYTPSRSVEWLVDERSVRMETEHVPNWRASEGMGLYMNFWAPEPGWGWAYNEYLKPVAAPPGETWHYYVKNAAVYYGT